MRETLQVIDKIRSFNRYYTNIIGLLDRHYLDSPFSLTEGRVLYEIKQIEQCSAKKIRDKIRIDEGYLSRIIDKFCQMGLITKIPSPDDRRVQIIYLTESGQYEFSKLNERSDELIVQIIEKLSEPQRTELAWMMERIQALLEKDR
jgi:DNA-binding MarR family transcriptional regulator